MSQSSDIRKVLSNCSNIPCVKENKTGEECIIKTRILCNSVSKTSTSVKKISKNPNKIVTSSKENKQKLKHFTPGALQFQNENQQLNNLEEKKSEKDHNEAYNFQDKPSQECEKKQMSSTITKELSIPKSSKNKENIIFVACPPKVLYKDPFKPVYHEHILKLSPFNLNADKRVAERKKFDKLIKEKEEETRRQMDLREKIQQEQKKKEQAEYRSRLVHHAKPAPNMSKPFIPQKSDTPLTIPKTPTRTRKIK